MSADRDAPPYRRLGAVFLVFIAAAGTLLFLQFRGAFIPSVEVTVVSGRAGLVVERGAKVTFNGVEIGRVTGVARDRVDSAPQARLTLAVDPRHLPLIPANATAEIRATTVFGNKYVALTSSNKPVPERLSQGSEVRAVGVTTEFNTVFETVTAIAEQVDPVKLNQTLSATAQALTGLGDRFGESLVDGNRILDGLNPTMPVLQRDFGALTALTDVYAGAAPNLFDGLHHAVTTARTLTTHRSQIDAALMAAIGFAEPATDGIESGGPYLARGAADLLPTTKLLDDYRGMIFCAIRNYDAVRPAIDRAFGGNGYSLTGRGTVAGAGNPFVYPDNLPRVNARGGPGGRPGCWHKPTRELYPPPYLVMDTGFSLAPYNHVELPSPMYVDYVWGRQVGEPTINP
ncbi:MCE family protein [Mycobacterium sp. NAZ190054]|uniref:MCE family protein n=1 Tax=Mycobacterium sp. NAZ190054 TaxID=1747766 RepID=UPI00079BBC61|nr:MCE family protein [Mycobacterium sp. NAZ190054]KWX66885.1 MCE-family protein MCE1A [Mycobacterium sp. NAZ190054]